MPHNIAAKSEAERKQIELDKNASMLIHQQRLGKASRADINKKIDSIEDITERERFRNSLNRFSKMKPARVVA